MSEATELLDAVTRLIAAIKSSQEDKLSAVLGPAIEYLVSMDKADRAARTSPSSAPSYWSHGDPMYQLERYVAMCEKLKLDPRDKGTVETILGHMKVVSKLEAKKHDEAK